MTILALVYLLVFFGNGDDLVLTMETKEACQTAVAQLADVAVLTLCIEGGVE